MEETDKNVRQAEEKGVMVAGAGVGGRQWKDFEMVAGMIMVAGQ